MRRERRKKAKEKVIVNGERVKPGKKVKYFKLLSQVELDKLIKTKREEQDREKQLRSDQE